MERMSGIVFLATSFLLFSLSSCHYPLSSEKFIISDLGTEGLQKDLEYFFQPFDSVNVLNKNQKYYISIYTRFNETCKINSLPLNIEWSENIEDTIHDLKISLPLFDKFNSNGKGNYGIFETEVPLIILNSPDTTFFVNISTPEKDTRGIIALGLICRTKQ